MSATLTCGVHATVAPAEHLSGKTSAVGPAAGIINGLGAGGGGTIAGFLVALMNSYTGSYMAGFMVLGVLVIIGGVCLLVYGRVMAGRSLAVI